MSAETELTKNKKQKKREIICVKNNRFCVMVKRSHPSSPVKPLAPLANILTRVYHVFATLFSSHLALNDSWKRNHWSRTLSTLEMPYLFFPSHSCITARKKHPSRPGRSNV